MKKNKKKKKKKKKLIKKIIIITLIKLKFQNFKINKNKQKKKKAYFFLISSKDIVIDLLSFNNLSLLLISLSFSIYIIHIINKLMKFKI